MLPIIGGELKRSLLRIALKRVPNEAVGIIYNDQAYELRNDSETPDHHFEFEVKDLRLLIMSLEVPILEVNEEVALWHSHPEGGVGPSRFDMQNRTPLKHHLVIALVDGDIVPTWY